MEDEKRNVTNPGASHGISAAGRRTEFKANESRDVTGSPRLFRALRMSGLTVGPIISDDPPEATSSLAPPPQKTPAPQKKESEKGPSGQDPPVDKGTEFTDEGDSKEPQGDASSSDDATDSKEELGTPEETAAKDAPEHGPNEPVEGDDSSAVLEPKKRRSRKASPKKL